jgi:5'-nucleotidase
MLRIYVDMDGTIADFYGAVEKRRLLAETTQEKSWPQSKIGFFLNLEPIEGAIEAINFLNKQYDVWFLTRPSFMNIHSYSEKASWIQKYFGMEGLKKLILCGNKSLLKGDYLIDDTDVDGQLEFEGNFIKIGSKEFPNWSEILKLF